MIFYVFMKKNTGNIYNFELEINDERQKANDRRN